MTKAQALVIGAASWNRMVHVDALPQGMSATIVDARQTEGAGSTGMGKAMALRALGLGVVLHCALGQDQVARRVIAAGTARGINMMVDRHDEATPQHLNIMDRQGGRYSIFLENGAEAPVVDEDRLAGAIARADVVFLSLAASSRKVLHLLDGAPVPVLLDLHDYDGRNPWYDAFIARADVVQLSDVALQAPDPVVERLLAGGAQQVVLTKGGEGAEIATGRARVIVPACAARMRDSNGAGDAFSVALWYAQAAGLDLADAGAFAAAAAAAAVESDDLFPQRVDAAAIAARAGLHPLEV